MNEVESTIVPQNLITFRVPGKPIALKRHRSSRNGHMYDPSANDKKVFLSKIQCHAPLRPISSKYALIVRATFVMPRPKKHFRTGRFSEELRKDAPCIHTSTPDIDNLAKFILDAMNEVFYEDDSQIYNLQCDKKYGAGNDDRKGYTDIQIECVIKT